MRRFLLTTVLLGAGLLPGVALAQQAPTNGAGLRYLSWPGKAAVAARATAPAPAPAVDVATEGTRPAPTRTAASTASLPLARIAPAPTPTSTSRGLTPASAWLAPRAAEPQPQSTSEPTPYRPTAPAPSAPEPASPEPTAPAPQTRLQPDPQPQPAPVQAAVAEAAAADPMAPRRDAPIFRLQRPDGTTAAAPEAGAAPSAQGARYYSVHRQAGHEPDAIRTPAPVYLDALPVQMAQTPNSADLAQPDGPPALVRNTNGSVRALPQTQADDLP